MIFLYPYFLLLLLVPIILLFIKRLSRKSNSWAAICDAHLLPYLTIETSTQKGVFYKNLMIGAWCLATICMAGPAVLKKDASTAFVGNGVAVVIDMSPAMDKQAAEQMTRKLYDLMAIKNDTAFGLVLVDNYAYTALPITQDKSIFQNIIPDLKERIMPSVGQNLKAGIEKAETLLKQSGFEKGQILLITAGVQNADELKQIVQKSSLPVHVLGVGDNAQQHPVTLPNGQFWGGQTPVLVGLDMLPSTLGSDYNYATLDDSDLKSVMDNLSVDKIEKSDAVMEQYQNLGIYGVLILLPIVALLFRRGVLFLFLICLFATPSYAGFWWRKEQELYQKQMQGIADFNVGQYEQAQKQFNDIASYDIDALYNLATAQAYAGKIEEAVATYKKVLERDPNYPDAEYNLKYLEEQIPPPPEQQSAQGQNNENSSKENQEDNQENSQNEKSEQSNDNNNKNEQGKENSDSSKSDDGEQSEEENSSAIEEQESNEKSDKAKQKSAENNGDDLTEQQATATLADITEQKDEQNEQMAPAMVPAKDQKQKEWLDKIKPNAGRVLRYRLLKQYQEQK